MDEGREDFRGAFLGPVLEGVSCAGEMAIGRQYGVWRHSLLLSQQLGLSHRALHTFSFTPLTTFTITALPSTRQKTVLTRES